MKPFALHLRRLQNIIKRDAPIEEDVFIEKMAEKMDLSLNQEEELKAKGTSEEKIDGIFFILRKKHPKKTYDNVLDALQEMQRGDIISKHLQASRGESVRHTRQRCTCTGAQAKRTEMPPISSFTRNSNRIKGVGTTEMQEFFSLRLDPRSNPRNWGLDEVEQCLKNNNLAMYCCKFREEEIHGTELLDLKRKDFKVILGIEHLGPIKRLQKAIKALKRSEKHFINLIPTNATNNHIA
ncbi:unnamed protein product [Darwinula stevensoni]|uniref:SAM domain-containing protein n=1 Tax=Darwinula stevensoni TaxID=69355 RepID=A0A7R9A2L5_9CRUS|nr:unnamed protein product [Darwinula stevensoni]CAG0885910.1 unnamed protein product [Darwinula stevensoni]